MKKFIILILLISFCTSPQSSELYESADEVIPSSGNEDIAPTTTTTSTTLPSTTTSTTLPSTTTSTTVPSTTTTTTTSTTSTTVPSTTTTTTTSTTTTTTSTTVPSTTIEIKLPNEPNQFPEIPYCKMFYNDVEEQLNNFFISKNIKITIREFIVNTPNVKCHGYVSGSNFSYLDVVNSGDFIEITVEGTEDKRKFPTTIANIENSKGNEEFFYLYCDINGLPITDKFWYGTLLQPYKIRDNIIYSQPNYLNVNLNDPLTNCAEEISLEDSCYWRVEFDYGTTIYRNYLFDAVNHYASSELYNSGADIFNSCPDLQGLKDGYVASDVDGEY